MRKTKRFTIDDLIPYLGTKFKIVGNSNRKFFTCVRSISEADSNSLVWVNPSRKDAQQLARQTKAEIIISDENIKISQALGKKCFIIVKNPKLVFLRIVKALFSEKQKYGVHRTAIIHPDARISKNVTIGPYTYIGRCEISSKTIIEGHVYIYDNVRIGKNVEIHTGAIIGCEGFNYAKNERGEYEKFTHIGGVVIKDNVEIGANTSVAKGVLGNSLIKKGSKIGSSVYLGSNVVIGKYCHIRMNATVSGSVIVGENSMIAPSAVVRDCITIGKNSIIGMGAVVVKDVQSNKVVVGNPARVMRNNI